MTEPSRQTNAVQVHEELMRLTIQMVGDHPEFAAGSVMRCVARAFRRAVRAGIAHDEIPAAVERSARQALSKRVEDFRVEDVTWSSGDPSRRARTAETRSALRRAG